MLGEARDEGGRGIRELAVVLEFVLQRCELRYDRFAFGFDVFVRSLSNCFVDIVYCPRLKNLSIHPGKVMIFFDSRE